MNEVAQERLEKGRGRPKKNIELRIISELMKNSPRSDRELAKVLGTSQPTVSRITKKLEEEGVIREYTMVPDFGRLGYSIAAFTLLRRKWERRPEQLEELKKRTLDYMEHASPEIVLLERGLGGTYHAIEVTFHRDYASFQQLRNRIKELGIFDELKCVSFLVDLNDEVHYRYFTLATLAKEFLASETKEKESIERKPLKNLL